jgi:hypothetical protein
MGDAANDCTHGTKAKVPRRSRPRCPARDGTVGAAPIGRAASTSGWIRGAARRSRGVPSFLGTHRTGEDLLGESGGTFVFYGLKAAIENAKQITGQGQHR